jgi:hypothetical protein
VPTGPKWTKNGYEPGGRRFESCRAHHTYQQFTPSRTVGASSTVPDLCLPLRIRVVMRDPTAVLVDVSRLGVWGALKASRAARYRRATRTAATCGQMRPTVFHLRPFAERIRSNVICREPRGAGALPSNRLPGRARSWAVDDVLSIRHSARA